MLVYLDLEVFDEFQPLWIRSDKGSIEEGSSVQRYTAVIAGIDAVIQLHTKRIRGEVVRFCLSSSVLAE